MNDTFTHNLLKELDQHYQSLSYLTDLAEPTATENYETLLMRWPVRDRRLPFFDFQMSFIPDLLGRHRGEVNLQLYVELNAQVSPEFFNQIYEMCAYINAYLPIGQFGLLPQLNTLYWKHNTFLSTKLKLPYSLDLVTHQVAFGAAMITLFSDELGQVGAGEKTAVSALKKHVWHSLFFPGN